MATYSVINNDKILPVDIDETLISYTTRDDPDFVVDYGGRLVPLKIKQMNRALVKHHKEVRGYFILVWSANGKEWAEQIINLLGLENTVDLIMTKPHKYVDDKDCNEWMASRIDLQDTLHG